MTENTPLLPTKGSIKAPTFSFNVEDVRLVAWINFWIMVGFAMLLTYIL